MSTAIDTRTASDTAGVTVRMPSKKRRRKIALRAIRRESGCGYGEAVNFLSFMEKMARYGNGEHHLTGEDYDAYHDIYALTMPAHAPSKPDTAHAAIEAYLGDEDTIVALKHTGTTKEGVRDCTTLVKVTKVSA